MPSDCIVFWREVLENNWQGKFAVSLTLTQGLREEKYLKQQKRRRNVVQRRDECRQAFLVLSNNLALQPYC